MYDTGKILAGLLVFLALITLPIWYNLSTGAAEVNPQPEIKTTEKNCVMDTDYMTANHMSLLNTWRDEVVREGLRFHQSPQGVEYKKSLTSTCLKCHSNKKNFCDRCHNYAAVKPYCWECHIIPEEN